jgi:hypothetical protein
MAQKSAHQFACSPVGQSACSERCMVRQLTRPHSADRMYFLLELQTQTLPELHSCVKVRDRGQCNNAGDAHTERAR